MSFHDGGERGGQVAAAAGVAKRSSHRSLRLTGAWTSTEKPFRSTLLWVAGRCGAARTTSLGAVRSPKPGRGAMNRSRQNVVVTVARSRDTMAKSILRHLPPLPRRPKCRRRGRASLIALRTGSAFERRDAECIFNSAASSGIAGAAVHLLLYLLEAEIIAASAGAI